ncbi:MAG TPA: T9SS type A sorting domain-containing protein, partial [Chitinophagaceae bacterium]|nr:T9SS type A sorting domain-containing protein [Chitinophagaceae bacterium]
TSTPNWTVGSYTGDNATGGKWIVAKPVSSMTGTGGDTIQTGHDHTTGSGFCAVTGNAASPTTVAGNADVDGGRTSLLTEEIDLSSYTKPVMSYWRWYSNSQGNNPRKDAWKVYASYTNGSTWLQVEKNNQPDVSWRRNLFVPDLSKGTKVRFLFIATDSVITGMGGSWVEAAVDDIEVLDLGAPASVNTVNTLQAMVYPNPANQSVQIVTTEKGMLSYTLMNTVGEVVLSKQQWTDCNLQLSISNLPSGIYFVRLKLNQQQSILKVRVQH